MEAPLRLNKHLAHQLGISRREADELIERGYVDVNGTTVGLGSRVSETDNIEVQGEPVARKQGYTYVRFNKPIGYVCSRKRQGEAPTIYEILPDQYHSLKPVGRLDKDSSGLLVMTDDGTFAHEMTHPSFHKTKSYEVSLDLPLAPLHRQMISDHGVTLDDGPSKLQLDRIDDSDDTRWRVQMHEGRNRQIRRTFLALGYTVTQLHRTHFGTYSLDDLAEGSFRPFTTS